MARSKGMTSPKAARRRERKRKAGVQIRQKKIFTYRGKTMEELKELSFDDFLKLVSSRKRRSFSRGLTHEHAKIISDVEKNSEKTIRTHKRDMIVIPQFIGRKFGIHNGQEFVEIEFIPEMLGHFFGELSQTRKGGVHSGPGVGATRSSKFMPLK